MTAARAAGLVLGCGLAAGCGGGPRDVAGTLTVGGKPVPKGVVWFDPAAGTDAPQGMATISDGQFDTRTAGRGVRAGEYLVRVEAFDGRPRPELPLGRPLPGSPFAVTRRFEPGEARFALDIPAPAKRRGS